MVAFAITAYSYAYKSKLSNSLKWILGSLRFLTIFTLFLLLVNPEMRSVSYRLEKPKLPIVLDVSSSVAALSDPNQAKEVVHNLISDPDLIDGFDISLYAIGNTFRTLDSIEFKDTQSRLDKVFESLEEIYSGTNAPTILISDGNQTFGRDYEFATTGFKNKVYPIILGDTTKYMDLKIAHLNSNRYSFLKNEFPVEVVLVYSGEESVESRFVLRKGATVLHSEIVRFSKEDNSKTINLTIPATEVGLQRYTAVVEPVADEKNTQNNTKLFAVEVIDQATNILIVSDVVHPDLGALKKAIETNEQRTVTFSKPLEAVSKIEDHQLLIFYQPTRSFNALLSAAERNGNNILWITGTKTDWSFLNNSQGIVEKEFARVDEEVGGRLNLNYGNYAVDDVDLRDYPPLSTTFGELRINVPHDILLQQEIDGILTGSPLLATTDLNGRKMGVLDAENLWKWRSHSFLEYGDFNEFDSFLGKLIQYLASNKRRSRLEVSHETFYYNNSPILISAQYFDQNFVFDNRAQLEIRVIHQETKEETVVPLLLKNTFYEVDLTTLKPGDYSFTVSVSGEGLSRSGNFTILEFNVEDQFLNADVTKLRRLATNTSGALFTPTTLDQLTEILTSDETNKPIERSQRKVVPLIDWKYLLAFLVITLASEWFIRKYNGLI